MKPLLQSKWVWLDLCLSLCSGRVDREKAFNGGLEGFDWCLTILTLPLLSLGSCSGRGIVIERGRCAIGLAKWRGTGEGGRLAT